jgi:hypothetical protein
MSIITVGTTNSGATSITVDMSTLNLTAVTVVLSTAYTSPLTKSGLADSV